MVLRMLLYNLYNFLYYSHLIIEKLKRDNQNFQCFRAKTNIQEV